MAYTSLSVRLEVYEKIKELMECKEYHNWHSRQKGGRISANGVLLWVLEKAGHPVEASYSGRRVELVRYSKQFADMEVGERRWLPSYSGAMQRSIRAYERHHKPARWSYASLVPQYNENGEHMMEWIRNA